MRQRATILAVAVAAIGLACLWGLPMPAQALEPAVPPPSATLEASPRPSATPTPEPTVSVLEKGEPTAPAPTATPVRHPISDLFVEPTAVPTRTPTPTPPPEALVPPVLKPSPTPRAVPQALPESEKPTPTPTPGQAAEVAKTTSSLATAVPIPIASFVPPLPTPTPPDNRLDLNTASEEQLAALPGMDTYRARLIVVHRQSVLGFHRIDQLRDVFGISEPLYQQIAPLLRVGPRSGYQKGTLETEAPPVLQVKRPTRPEVRMRGADSATTATPTPDDSMLPSIAP